MFGLLHVKLNSWGYMHGNEFLNEGFGCIR